jgi:NAD(P)-dependent dehydrogenase (short-subunit alcohol dehydrogenase family)
MSAAKRVAAIVGVGPGLGRALALRFGRGGFAVALLARRSESVTPVKAEVEEFGGVARAYTCDATDETSTTMALSGVRAELGDPEVVVYNAGSFQMAGVLELTPADLERSWRVNCQGALVVAQAVLPPMLERGGGTLLFSGASASLRGSARFAALAVGKFGLRALAQSMARELGPKGIHVAHVVIDGVIDSPRARSMLPDRAPDAMLAPTAIAETFWHLHAQDRTAWTLEVDLRPSVEKF